MTTPHLDGLLAFVETFPTPLFCFDLQLNCLWFNATAALLVTDLAVSPLGQPLEFLGSMLAPLRPRLERLCATQQGFQDLPLGSLLRGSPMHTHTVTAFPVFSPSGTFFAIGCVLTDVTLPLQVQQTTQREHQNLQQQIRQQANQIQDLNAELETYLTALAHDIQAPLQRIQGFLALLNTQVGPQLTERSSHYLQMARQESARLGQITMELEQLQQFLRHTFHPVLLPLNPLILQIRSDLQPDFHDRTTHWEIGELPVVLGDAVMLRQALTVLLQYALTFTRDTRDARISIWAETTTDAHLLFIHNTGPGFAPETTAAFFHVFGHLQDPHLEGAGLDMAAVRRIVTQHGGQVSVESAEGIGTTFQVRFPLAVPPDLWYPARADEHLQGTGIFSPGEAQFLNRVFGAALHQADTSIIITDATQHIVYVNPSFTEQTGYTFHEVVGRNPRFLQGPGTDPAARQVLREYLLVGKPVHQLILNYDKQGRPMWFYMHVSPLYEQGTLRFFVALQENATERIEQQVKIEWNADHDALTGVRNRHGMEIAIKAQVQQVQPFALLIFDLDNFKQINDQQGHSAGDEVIRRVAQVLTSQARPSDQVFRLGGDEFLVLLPGEGEEGAQGFVTRIQSILGQPDQQTPVTVSVGIALYPEDETEVPHLIRLADARMYRQKMGRPSRRTSES